MKSLISLWKTSLEELGDWCGVSANRDFQTVSARIEDEGLSFLTITLSNFAKDFQKSLAQGYVGHDSFLGFKRRGGLPLFLGGFLDLIFDRCNGSLVNDPSQDAIFSIRQLTLMYSKIELECSPKRVRSAFEGYVNCEKELKEKCWDEVDFTRFDRMVSLLFGDYFSAIDGDIYSGEVSPRHGPGATADRLRGNAKYNGREWTQRLEAIFPFGENHLSSWSHWRRLEDVKFLEPGAERPVKVVSVPKTLKTPRIIAEEPTCMQFMQQAVLASMMRHLKRDDILYQMVGFDDQVPNRLMAMKGSLTGSLATLDLKEASDRVSNQLVRRMFKNFPYLGEALDSTRSRKADVPGHGVIRLSKFASMGSAVTFPVEAFVFLTLVFLGIENQLSVPMSRRNVATFLGDVRVYGDDIIVPVTYTASVIDSLENFGFQVNHDKSFWTGEFRESCGGDYFSGFDVTPVKVRRLIPTDRNDAQGVASTVATRNLFYKRGMWRTASQLDSFLFRALLHFPVVGESSPVLGRFSFLGYETQKVGSRLHRPLVRGYTISAPSPESILDDEPALFKFFSARGKEPLPKRHLEVAGRPPAVYLKLGWNVPY